LPVPIRVQEIEKEIKIENPLLRKNYLKFLKETVNKDFYEQGNSVNFKF